MTSDPYKNVILSETIYDPDFSAARTLRRAMEAADKGGLPPEICDAFSLFISEIVANLIRHCEPAASQITLELSTMSGSWVCQVLDNGPSFSAFSISLAKAQEGWAANRGRQESGMGLAMIASMLPDFWYETAEQSSDGLNAISVRYPARKSVITRPRIVVVDDDIMIRLLIRALFNDSYHIRSFPDAILALEELNDEPVDLVISDIQMPEMNGLEFREELSKRDDDLIPFIFLTAQSDLDVANEASDLGIDDYIEKSVAPGKLKATVQRLLRRRESMRDKLWEQMSKDVTEPLEPTSLGKIGPYECAVRSRVASAGGGDICLPVGEKGVFFADVMGHGVRAKMIAHTIAAYVRGLMLSSGEDWDPSDFMTKISNAIGADETCDSTIVSALLVKVMDDGAFRLASAGHPFPVRFVKDEFSYIEIGGPLLGMTQGQIYKTVDLRLDDNSALLFLTDGLFEISKSIDVQRGAETKMYETTLAILSQSVNGIADELMSTFDTMTSGQPPDDATIFIIKT